MTKTCENNFNFKMILIKMTSINFFKKKKKKEVT
jgi:hypothetical protein